MDLCPSPTTFIPLIDAKTWIFPEFWPEELPRWMAAGWQRRAAGEPMLDDVLMSAIYEVSHALWLAILDEGLPLYYLDAESQRYVAFESANLRKVGKELAESARTLGAPACAEWMEGSRRRFDREFFDRVREEERRLGRPLDGTNFYSADFYVRHGDLRRMLPPPVPSTSTTTPEPAPAPAPAPAPEETRPRKPRKYIYTMALPLLDRNPKIAPKELIELLKKKSHIRVRSERLVWTDPASGRDASVSEKSFARYIRKLKEPARKP